MELLKPELWRDREDEPRPRQKRGSAVLWEGELAGDRYRMISRAAARVYQRRVAGELPGDWRWRDWPTQDVLRLIEAAYTGVGM